MLTPAAAGRDLCHVHAAATSCPYQDVHLSNNVANGDEPGGQQSSQPGAPRNRSRDRHRRVHRGGPLDDLSLSFRITSPPPQFGSTPGGSGADQASGGPQMEVDVDGVPRSQDSCFSFGLGSLPASQDLELAGRGQSFVDQ